MVKPGGLLIAATLNRTLKAYALAIVGAEYILGWLPRGPHDWKKFVQPHELAGALRHAGLSLRDVQGVSYDPLNDRWQLGRASCRERVWTYVLISVEADSTQKKASR